MSRFAFTKRDYLVLFGIAWAVVLLYCFYLIGAKAMDLRRKAIIDANRTRNDIVIDNTYEIMHALTRYKVDHAGNGPPSLDKILGTRYLRKMPTNPYTAQPVRLVRMGERKCEGELTFMKGSSYIGNVSTSELNRNDDLLIIAYGNREEGFIKYADWRFFPEGNELWSDELASKLVWITGGLAVGGKTMGGGAYWYRDSDEEIYTANGYTLPIQMEKEAFPGDDQ